MVLVESLQAVHDQTARIERYDRRLAELVPQTEQRKLVSRQSALKPRRYAPPSSRLTLREASDKRGQRLR